MTLEVTQHPQAPLPGGATLRKMLKTDEDYRIATQIQAAHWPTWAQTVEEYRKDDERWPEGATLDRWFIEVDGRAVGRLAIEQSVWLKEPGVFSASLQRLPELQGSDLEAAAIRWVIAEAMTRLPRKLRAFVDSRNISMMRVYEDAGFEIDQVQKFTCIDVQNFNEGAFQPSFDRLASEGVRILTAADLIDEGRDWMPEAYDLVCALIPDVPPIGEMNPFPYDIWKQYVEDAIRTGAEGIVYALDDGRMVGQSELWASEADPTRFHTGLTGVLRSHRRRGIATALKARALGYAQRQGCRQLLTDNASTNPMYGLNLALGFTDLYEGLVLMKIVER